MVPALYCNLKRALIPLLHEDTYKTMDSVTHAVDLAGRNPRNRPPQPKRKHTNIATSGSNFAASTDVVALDPVVMAIDGDDNEDEASINVEAGGSGMVVCSPDGFCAPCFELA